LKSRNNNLTQNKSRDEKDKMSFGYYANDGFKRNDNAIKFEDL
jgi:hypothetical protein